MPSSNRTSSNGTSNTSGSSGVAGGGGYEVEFSQQDPSFEFDPFNDEDDPHMAIVEVNMSGNSGFNTSHDADTETSGGDPYRTSTPGHRDEFKSSSGHLGRDSGHATVRVGNANNTTPDLDIQRTMSTATTSTTPNSPVDLDDLFERYNLGIDLDDSSLFSEDSDAGAGKKKGKKKHNPHDFLADDDYDSSDEEDGLGASPTYFHNPHKRLLDADASLIPGSPFSKPANKKSNRPTEPLAIAKYASTLAACVTLGWVVFLFFVAIWNYSSVARIIIECLLAILSFFGLFWNSYFIVSSILKCFIPAEAFKTNTKYCSIIPETKSPNAAWLDVTIQIPVYKESLQEVLMPTLKSCQKSRDYYEKQTGATCNIVVCDDGMMAFLRDNFPAAEMLWNSILDTKGRVIKLSSLLNRVPRASRRHLKGLRSRAVYEVFHRMLYYYHYRIGFVARSTVDRRGKFKKASNLNSHLRLGLGAAQLSEKEDITFQEALLQESHNEDGSRFVMFGNDVHLGHLICINDADARMAEQVIVKTVPEFLNDKSLGFTQHATKTMNEQRGESYYTNLLAVYTDALYQGHFLLSSILGCHPPLVGHSIFLRTEAVKQCGRMRTLRKAQRWLRNIGLPFLPVDQVGFSNLQAENRTEYWSENHVSEDFELMIHLYNLGFNGRYCAYPDCEFQEGITRTFDEEAGRHRKFALGAHELVFNPFADMLGHGIFTPLFRTFLSCDIPSYYKIFLTAYLCSYTTGGTYLIIFVVAAITRLLDSEDVLSTVALFSPAGIIILNIVIYYIIGYSTILISMCRMHKVNPKILFPEYRKKWCGGCYIIFVMLRYCLVFQFLFYTVATFSFYFLGSMDHLLSRPGVVSATNKDSITISRCTAFWDMARFNSGSWLIAFILAGLGYATYLQDMNWDVTAYPTEYTSDVFLVNALFVGPAILIAIMTVVNPILLNPFILGWPFLRQPKPKKPLPKNKRLNSGKKSSAKKSKSSSGKPKKTTKDPLGRVVELRTFIDKADELNNEMERVNGRPDEELGSLQTTDLFSKTSGSSERGSKKKMNMQELKSMEAEWSAINNGQRRPSGANNKMYSIPEADNKRSQHGSSHGRSSKSNRSSPSSSYIDQYRNSHQYSPGEV